MGRYLNPATPATLNAVGARELVPSIVHADYMAQLQPGECLGWALAWRSIVQIADVTDRNEYRTLGDMYLREGLGNMGFYAIPSNAPGWSHPLPASVTPQGASADDDH